MSTKERRTGTVSRGIRCPIIREGDDLAAIVADSVLEAAEAEGFSILLRPLLRKNTLKLKLFSVQDTPILPPTAMILNRLILLQNLSMPLVSKELSKEPKKDSAILSAKSPPMLNPIRRKAKKSV